MKRLHMVLLAAASLNVITAVASAAPPAPGATASTDSPDTSEEGLRPSDQIVVTATRVRAGGLMTPTHGTVSESLVTADFIKTRPVSNALQLISALPGVNFGSSDPLGLSIRNSLSVRGYDQTEMGFVYDNIPIMDPTFFLPFTEAWADNENYKSINLTPGTSKLTDPVQSASGGVLSGTSRDPSKQFGGLASFTVGSFSSRRAFGRIDTGLLGSSGLSAYASYSYTQTDNWRGDGTSRRFHIDAKVEKEWGDIGTSKLTVARNVSHTFRLSNPTLAQYQALGKDSNYASVYTPNAATYYKFAYLPRKTTVIGLNNNFNITPDWSINVTPYYMNINTDSPGGATFRATTLFRGTQPVTVNLNGVTQVNGAYTVKTQTFQQSWQEGVNSYSTFRLGSHNQVTVGYWYDHWNKHTVNPLSPVDGVGNVNDDVFLYGTDGSLIAGSQYQMHYDINSLYAEDLISLMSNRLKIALGFKQFMIRTEGAVLLPGPQGAFVAKIHKSLPRVTASFDLDSKNQIYAGVLTNSRPPIAPATYVNTYSVTTGALSQAANLNAKAEYSLSEEIGLRHTGVISVSVALFNAHLKNHQVATNIVLNGANVASAISVGSQTVRGVTAELSTKSYGGFSGYLSGQYLRARTDDDFAVGNDFLPTQGKTAVRSPKFMGNAGLIYNRGSFFGNIVGKYVGSQFSTFMNDEKMPSFGTMDVSLGYHLPDIGKIKGITLKANFLNLVSKTYLGTINSPTPNALPTVGRKGTIIAGSSPTYFPNSGFSALFSIEAGF